MSAVSNFSGWHLMKSLSVADRYGYPRYVAHQTYYSLIGRDYEWELMPLGFDQGSARWFGARSAGAGSRAKYAAGSRCRRRAACTRRADKGPPVDDEQLYSRRRCSRQRRERNGQERSRRSRSIGCCIARPFRASSSARATSSSSSDNLGAVGWSLTAEQIKKLDAASATAKPYPYWHQSGFSERNPPPV